MAGARVAPPLPPEARPAGLNPSEPDQVFKLKGKAVPLVP